MRNRPRLVITCGRCGQPREGLRHVCVSNSKRRATLKPAVDLGTCGTCKKPLGNPLTHVCAPRSDFRARKARAAKRERDREREKARKKRQGEKHDYQACRDPDCPRPLCKAFKGGWKLGYDTGHDDGWALGYDTGHKDGIADCPRPHGTG